MSTSFTLPELGEGIDSATVVEIFVQPGDTIQADQPLLSLETDKAQFELPATAAGTVEQVLVGVGDDVRIGQPILTVADGGEEPKAAAPPRARAPADAHTPAADAAPAPPPKTAAPSAPQ